MFDDAPEESYFLEVGGDGRCHPYAMYRTVNRPAVEVVHTVTDDDGSVVRRVLLVDDSYEVWVRAGEYETYGYDLQPEERVSEGEREAIRVKQEAIGEDDAISVGEAMALVRSVDDAHLSHALIAVYHAAKADPDIGGGRLDRLRAFVTEQTGYVDTDDPEVVSHTLREVLGGDGDDDDDAE